MPWNAISVCALQFRDAACAALGLADACASGDVRVWDYYDCRPYLNLEDKLDETLEGAQITEVALIT